jgi:hypothetical protein
VRRTRRVVEVDEEENKKLGAMAVILYNFLADLL